MDETEIRQALAAAANADRQGRGGDAERRYDDIRSRFGDHPLVLNALGLRALGRADHADAAALFRRAIAADAGSPDLWMNLAKACRMQHDDAAEQAALHGALALDQRHFMALVRLAELLERTGNASEAAQRWSGVLTMAGMIDDRSPALEMMLEHARDYVAGHRAAFAAAIDTRLADARGAVARSERRRFDACIDHVLGRREIYANRCAGTHFPFLPADEFFDREHLPWLADIEAETGAIRDELMTVLAADSTIIRPYVAMAPGTPDNKWSPLDHSLDWGAFHLWKDGRRDAAACARFPRTAAAVERLPLCDLPGRTPAVFFSLLRAGAHLPAHTGVSNVRTIIHLPLIVPAGCVFRVGGETREWEAGRAWAFDDTIEHEAWNRSAETRAILIFDVWNPHLTTVERELLRQFYRAAAEDEWDLERAIAVSD